MDSDSPVFDTYSPPRGYPRYNFTRSPSPEPVPIYMELARRLRDTSHLVLCGAISEEKAKFLESCMDVLANWSE